MILFQRVLDFDKITSDNFRKKGSSKKNKIVSPVDEVGPPPERVAGARRHHSLLLN